uniref:Putative chymotrypsin-elastase inhibitor ixodidin n=1 Tax=Ornithodoros turicata TaxID=34597 RepID=A0A2R5LMA0_9ACAR
MKALAMFMLSALLLVSVFLVEADAQACFPGAVYSNCGTACPEVCRQPPPRFCTQQCVRGCFCRPGLILDQSRRRCIPRHICPFYG